MVSQQDSSSRKTASDEKGSAGESGSDGDKDKKKIDLSPAKVVGAALASVTAAFLGGHLGVAGTVLGAALTSVVLTVGSALYQRWLEKTKEKAVNAAKTAEKRLQRTSVERQVSKKGEHGEVTRKLRLTPEMHWPGGETVVDQDRVAKVDGEGPTRLISTEPPRRNKKVRWAVVAVSCAAAFGLSMLIITGFEGLTGKSISGGDDGTTVGQVLQPQPRKPSPTSETTKPTRPVEKPAETQQPTTTVAPPPPVAETPTAPVETPTQQPTQAPTSEQAPPSESRNTEPPQTGLFPPPTYGR